MKLTFKIADLMVATALIGAGVAFLIPEFGVPLGSRQVDETPALVGLALFFLGPTAIGAGIGWPLQRPMVGAALGFAAASALFAIFLLFFAGC